MQIMDSLHEEALQVSTVIYHLGLGYLKARIICSFTGLGLVRPSLQPIFLNQTADFEELALQILRPGHSVRHTNLNYCELH